MFSRTVRRNESDPTKRRLYFHLVDATDGFTPETGEAAGQPQISTDGANWTNNNVGTLTHVGNGTYYADVAQAGILINSGVIMGRYKSAATREALAVNALDVGGDLQEAIAVLTNTRTYNVKTGQRAIKHADGTTVMFTIDDGDMAGDVQTFTRT